MRSSAGSIWRPGYTSPTLLKRLKLGRLVPMLRERLAVALAQHLDYAAFLTLLLADEVQRREQQALGQHLIQAASRNASRWTTSR